MNRLFVKKIALLPSVIVSLSLLTAAIPNSYAASANQKPASSAQLAWDDDYDGGWGGHHHHHGWDNGWGGHHHHHHDWDNGWGGHHHHHHGDGDWGDD